MTGEAAPGWEDGGITGKLPQGKGLKRGSNGGRGVTKSEAVEGDEYKSRGR